MAKPGTAPDTSASDTSIGFDYQFYYFFYLILRLYQGETISFEVKDDIHVKFANGNELYIQTKHTVQKSAGGTAINLTERDVDLWKTLYNWSVLILSQVDKKSFLATRTFQLITNKNNASNPVLVKAQMVKDGTLSIEDFQTYLTTLHNGTTDQTIKSYIKSVAKIPKTILKLFLSNLQFGLSEDNLIDRIKTRILEKIHLDEKIDVVYSSLHSALRDTNYLTVKNGEKIEVSFDTFNSRFKSCFRAGLSSKLPIREVSISLPDDPSRQLFIQQLIDIGDLDQKDTERMIELTTHLLKLYNNLKEWETHEGLLAATKRGFNRDTVIRWTNSFNALYREIDRQIKSGSDIKDLEDDIKHKALSCLDEMRKQILKIEDTDLDIELSNGQFYLLTDERSIGWHFDWKERYKA